VYADLTGGSAYLVADTASYTVDPFVEEVAKVAPLLLLAVVAARGRRQRGLSDYLLLGAATGAGFALAEALLRFGTRAGTAVGMPGGWLLPVSLSPPTIPSPAAAVGSWLPAPAGGDALLSLGAGSGTNLHLAWSALAGLGIGLLIRGRGWSRLGGPVLILLAGADHAAYNFDLSHPGDTGVGARIAAPFVTAQPLLWLWPLLALVVAVALDLRWLRRAQAVGPDLRLRREHHGQATAQLAGYSLQGLPWTPLVIARFTLLRRAAAYQARPTRQPPPDLPPADTTPPGPLTPLQAEVARIRDQLDAADSPAAWNRVRRPSLPRQAPATKRSWLRVAWALLHATAPSAPLLPAHLLDALDQALLIVGVALLIAAIVFFPPSIELLPLALATGSQILIPVITASGAFTATASLGVASIWLSQAAGSTGSSNGINTTGAGTEPGPPRLDGTGKVHGDIPDHVPRSWTTEQLEELEVDLQRSIRTRKLEQRRLGEDPAHRRRLGEEERLLRQIQKILSGT
jgi:hypothetical protein